MNSLSINEEYNGINVQASFHYKFNILTGDSGTGKTLLLKAIDFYCLNNDIKCKLCSYNEATLSKKQIASICSDTDILLLDNADLYVDNELLEIMLSTSKILIISMKDTSNIDTSDAEQYLVDYSNKSLTIRNV